MDITVIESKDCGCCKTYRQKINAIADRYGFSIRFIDIDSDDIDLSAYDFKGLPFTIVSDNGENWYFTGDMGESMIKSQLRIEE